MVELYHDSVSELTYTKTSTGALEVFGAMPPIEVEDDVKRWDDYDAMTNWRSWGDLNVGDENAAGDSTTLALNGALGSTYYVTISGVDAEYDCELTGTGVSNYKLDVLGYTGPFQPEGETAYICGVLFTVDKDENTVADSISATLGTPFDSVALTITVTAAAAGADETAGDPKMKGAYHSIVMLKVPDDATDATVYEYDFGDGANYFTIELTVTSLSVVDKLLELMIPLAGFFGLLALFLVL